MASRLILQASIMILIAVLSGCREKGTTSSISGTKPMATQPSVNEGSSTTVGQDSSQPLGIAFVSDRDHPETPGEGELYLMRPDGMEQRRLTCDLRARGALVGDISDVSGHLSWSSSTQSFLWATGKLGRIDLADSSIEDLGLGAWHIDVSNEANTLTAMVQNRVTGGDIALLRLDGSRPITITDGTTRSLLSLPLDTPFYGPAISSDGNGVAFLSLGRMFLVGRSGENPRQLTPNIRATWPLSWSPDGEQIAFSVLGSQGPAMSLKRIFVDTGEIYDMNPDGSGPAWSSDGSHIAFARSDGQIWIAKSDGSEMRQLTFEGQNCCPMWIANPEDLLPYVKTACAEATPTPETLPPAGEVPPLVWPTPVGNKSEVSGPLGCIEVAGLPSTLPDSVDPAALATLVAQSTAAPELLGTWCADQPVGDLVVVFDPNNHFSWAGEIGTHYDWSTPNFTELFPCRYFDYNLDKSKGGIHWNYYTINHDDGGSLVTLTDTDTEGSESIVLRRMIEYSSRGSAALDIVGKWKKAETGDDVVLEYTSEGEIIEHLQNGETNVFGQYTVYARERAGNMVSFTVGRARFDLPLVMGGSVMAIGDRCDQSPDEYLGLDTVWGMFVRIE